MANKVEYHTNPLTGAVGDKPYRPGSPKARGAFEKVVRSAEEIAALLDEIAPWESKTFESDKGALQGMMAALAWVLGRRNAAMGMRTYLKGVAEEYIRTGKSWHEKRRV